MEDLNSGDSVGAGTNGTGGVLVSVWWKDQDGARALLTIREAEWFIEHLTETLEKAKNE